MKPFSQKISYNRPCLTGREMEFLGECVASQKFSGDGGFTKRATALLKAAIQSDNILLTTSCTDALEMCALLLDIKPGDEVIMPSFTFVSSANAVVLRGAKVVFVDVDPGTMNVDPALIESAISERTKAIVVMHYAGVACDMKAILALREKYGIPIVEDAAQGIMAKYEGKFLGTIGDLGCFSFHETKNLQCGEGGALSVNNPALFERAEILREKGTNRSKFFRGQADKYTWMDLGSSFLMADLTAAFLNAQLEQAVQITERRLSIWNKYREAFAELEKLGLVEMQKLPAYAEANGHIFYLKLKNEPTRAKFISYLGANGINSVFHYIPLHSSPAGLQYSAFHGEDKHTTLHSERLVRLPLYFAMTEAEQDRVILAAREFFLGASASERKVAGSEPDKRSERIEILTT
ncbi:MAG: dTDP-4-amino-4,6-dideoxygalactose transaminase [Bdellovibrionota bacterium]